MPWVEVFAVFLVSHLVGDYLLQTDWQATHKLGGLGRDRQSRAALFSHTLTYALAFLPAFIWLADELGAGVLGIGALIVGPHLVQDDGRLLATYLHKVKRLDPRSRPVVGAVDQSFHVLALFLVALLAGD